MKWIDVRNKKTPLESARDVLLYDCRQQSAGIGFLYVNDNGRFWHWYGHPSSPIAFDADHISHWMSLPYWSPGLDPEPAELFSIGRELPNHGDKVILFNPWLAGHFSIGHLMQGGRHWHWDRGNRSIPVQSNSPDHISHWMPLPDPPSTFLP